MEVSHWQGMRKLIGSRLEPHIFRTRSRWITTCVIWPVTKKSTLQNQAITFLCTDYFLQSLVIININLLTSFWSNMLFVEIAVRSSQFKRILKHSNGLGFSNHVFVKVPRRSSSQAATCYYQSNHSKVEAIR